MDGVNGAWYRRRVNAPTTLTRLPGPLIALVALYFAASLAHFSHNAEAIAFYPGMPHWVTRETVYRVWCGITAIGVLAFVLLRWRQRALGLLALALYGACGLDGLAHYTLALCSEHTLLANLTIWAEAATGLLVLLASAVLVQRGAAPSQVNRVLF